MTTKIGHYDLVTELGRGGMGVVYKGHEAALNRYVAIKMLSPQLAHDESIKERFLREARSMAALNDPHIIQVYFIGEDGGQPFPGGRIEMELEHADQLKRVNVSADIDTDGRFKLAALEGKHRVLLLPPMPPVTARKRRPLTPYNDKYRTYENSGLSIEVTRDASKNKVKLTVFK